MKSDKIVKILISCFSEESPVQTFEEMKKKSCCQPRTLQRKIKRCNLLVSFNKNAKFYTLPSLAHFNKDGIWNCRKILFSRFGNLFATIIVLIDKSVCGYTGKELSDIIEVKADDALYVLWQKKRIHKQKTGGRNVYFSIRNDLFATQLAVREQRTALPVPTLILSDYQRIIAVLVEIIQQDSILPEKLQKGIEKRNIEITIVEILTLIEHYQLKKKKGK